jgi:hypothetical protein
MQAFTFNWIYFDIDGRNINLHAIRRSAISGKTSFVGFSSPYLIANKAIIAGLWGFSHLPFVMGYIVATSALSRLVLATDVPGTDLNQLAEPYRDSAEDQFNAGVRFFYCHGLAIALLCTAAISFSHEHKKQPTLRMNKNMRLANRVAVCVIMFFLPLATSLRSLNLISITLSLTVWVLIVELWGKSCTDDPFFGEKDGRCITYCARCKKNDVEEMIVSDETPLRGEVLELDRADKTAI